MLSSISTYKIDWWSHSISPPSPCSGPSALSGALGLELSWVGGAEGGDVYHGCSSLYTLISVCRSQGKAQHRLPGEGIPPQGQLWGRARMIYEVWLQDTPCHTLSTCILPACLLPSATQRFIRAAVGGEITSDYYLLLYTFLYFHTVCSKWVLLIIFPCLFPLGYNICSLLKKNFF